MKFRKNPALEEQIKATPRYRDAMHDKAGEVARNVRAVAPKETGYYTRRIRVKGNQVVAEDPFWHLVEFGSVNNPPYAPLRRGVRAAGLRLNESPRP